MGGETTILATGALLVLCMGLWATALLPEIVTALPSSGSRCCSVSAAAATVFSGFSSSAFWLVMSGMVVGQGMTRTGLGARMAQGAAPGASSGSYPRFIAGLVTLSFLIAFVMPSNLGRIALMIPVTLALCDAFGLAAGRPGRTGAVLAVGARDADPVGGDPARQRPEPRDGRLRGAAARPAPLLPVLSSCCTRRSWRWSRACCWSR